MKAPKRASRIAAEIQQGQPFRSAQQEAGIALLRTADVVKRRVQAVIAPSGVTGQQYNVLRIVRGAGEAGIPTLEIAKRMIEQTPGITRLLDRLESRRLVRRQRCPNDRRQVLCWITTEGLAVLADLDEPVARADTKALGRLSKTDARRLVVLLDRIREEVEAKA